MSIQKNLKERRDKILECLKDGNEKATSEIRAITGIDFYGLKAVLLDMAQEKKPLIEKREEGKTIYWRLKNGK